jgi:predicted RNA-binding protein with PUA-like domain
MNYFLAKTEPSTYSIDDLEKDGQTSWDGVTNAQAVRTIRSMRPGDTVLIYHSGGESRIVGVARVVSAPRDAPGNARSVAVDVAYVSRVTPAVTLAEVKASGQFDAWALVRQSRLSTMAVPGAFIEWMRANGRGIA